MKIFIVRHGSTQHLEDNRRQTFESSLSQQGLQQVERIAQRLTKFKIDLFWASPLKRTLETADAISKSTGLNYIEDKRLREIDQSEELYGAKCTDDVSKKYDDDKLNRLNSLDWKFLDEGESLRDVLTRMADLKNELIGKHIDKNILLVSHAYAIRCFIANCILGDDYKDEAIIRVFHAIRISKASLSVLEYRHENKYFYVNLLNDTTHLEEDE